MLLSILTINIVKNWVYEKVPFNFFIVISTTDTRKNTLLGITAAGSIFGVCFLTEYNVNHENISNSYVY